MKERDPAFSWVLMLSVSWSAFGQASDGWLHQRGLRGAAARATASARHTGAIVCWGRLLCTASRDRPAARLAAFGAADSIRYAHRQPPDQDTARGGERTLQSAPQRAHRVGSSVRILAARNAFRCHSSVHCRAIVVGHAQPASRFPSLTVPCRWRGPNDQTRFPWPKGGLVRTGVPRPGTPLRSQSGTPSLVRRLVAPGSSIGGTLGVDCAAPAPTRGGPVAVGSKP